MPCFTEEAKQLIIGSDGGAERYEGLEKSYEKLIQTRVDYVDYGNPNELSAQRRAKLNCDLLKQVLIYRAEQLMTASGTMLTQKNLYALALTVRGHIETLAVLGYFTRRLESLVKGNVKFEQFEEDIANGLLGAKHDFLFGRQGADQHRDLR